jgi:hypothetical protein
MHGRALEQRADLALCLVSLRHRGLREPPEQSRHGSYVLASLGEAWESIVVLDDSSVRVASTCTHLVMVLCDLVLERRTLLLQMESRGFKLSLSLPPLVHTWVGWGFCIRRSSAPIDRMRGSPM